MVRLIPSLLAMATVLGGVIGCSAHQPPTPASGCRQLDAFLKWHHGVREFLQSAIDANSRCTGTADGSARKVAIFDWDNTVVKNDIGYATNYYMLQHSLVLQPANQDWHAASRYLTDAAANALSVACGKVVPAGKPLPTGSNALCANEILSLLDGETTTGQPAFVGNNVRRLARRRRHRGVTRDQPQPGRPHVPRPTTACSPGAVSGRSTRCLSTRCPSTLLTYAGRHSSTPTDRNNRYCATTAPQSPIKSTRSSDF